MTIKPALDRLYAAFNEQDAATDPIQLVRPYVDPADREIAGFCAASLAFGRVASVLHSVQQLLVHLGPHPAAFVRQFDPDRDGAHVRSLGHRWIRGTDLVALLWVLRQMLDEAGSIERFFAAGYDAADVDVGPALERFCARAVSLDLARAYGRVPQTPGVCYFFPRPSGGSACKRLNLFLRWMVRRDAVDLGVWTTVRAASLVVPLDTHVIRVGRCLRLTRYISPGWRMAAEITASLRLLDAADPIRYDFALCHLGMMGACGFSRPQQDVACPLRGVCRPRVGRRRSSPAPSALR